MQFDQRAHQRKSDAEPAAGIHALTRNLREQLEDMRHGFGGDADAAVANADLGHALVGAGGEHDAATLARVLGGVVQEVAHDLGEPHRVAAHGEVGVGVADFEFLLFLFEQGLHGFHRRGDDLRHVHALGDQHDLAARDARHVEQVIDEADHVLQLPLDDTARPDDLRILRLALHEHVRGIAQRGQVDCGAHATTWPGIRRA